MNQRPPLEGVRLPPTDEPAGYGHFDQHRVALDGAADSERDAFVRRKRK